MKINSTGKSLRTLKFLLRKYIKKKDLIIFGDDGVGKRKLVYSSFSRSQCIWINYFTELEKIKEKLEMMIYGKIIIFDVDVEYNDELNKMIIPKLENKFGRMIFIAEKLEKIPEKIKKSCFKINLLEPTLEEKKIFLLKLLKEKSINISSQLFKEILLKTQNYIQIESVVKGLEIGYNIINVEKKRKPTEEIKDFFDGKEMKMNRNFQLYWLWKEKKLDAKSLIFLNECLKFEKELGGIAQRFFDEYIKTL